MKIEVTTKGDPSVGIQGDYAEIELHGIDKSDLECMFDSAEEARRILQQFWSRFFGENARACFDCDGSDEPPVCAEEFEPNDAG